MIARSGAAARATALAIALAMLTAAPLAIADPAPAPSDPAAALGAKQRGDDALVNGRPAEALALYKEAYAARPDPALVYNIGRAHQALGDFPSALDHLEQFEATAPP